MFLYDLLRKHAFMRFANLFCFCEFYKAFQLFFSYSGNFFVFLFLGVFCWFFSIFSLKIICLMQIEKNGLENFLENAE